MKRKDHIQRNVKSGQTFREKGSAPIIGHVARMPGASIRPVSPEQVEQEVSSFGKRVNRRSGTWIVSVILAGATILLIVVAFYLWLSPFLDRRDKMTAIAERERESLAPIKPVENEPEALTEKSALSIIKRALAASSVAEVEARIIPGSASPDEVLQFLKAMPERDGKIERYDWVGTLNKNGIPLELTTIAFSGKEKPVYRMAILVRDEDRGWKLDFEAFARWAKPGWDEFLTGSAEEIVVRVLVGQDQYYNGPFQDETQWQSFGLVSPDVDQLFSGYCRVGSPQQRAILSSLADTARGMARLTLKIRKVEGAGPRQTEIVRVLAQDWVMGPTAFDEAIQKNAVPNE
jgi:hypothetical protein